MAWGKDDSQIKRITAANRGSLGQHANIERARREEQKKNRANGGASYWRDRFKLSKEFPSMIRLIPGSYSWDEEVDGQLVRYEGMEYYLYVEHTHGATKRGCICSGGPFRFTNSESREPCIGCTIRDEDYANSRGRKDKVSRMGVRVVRALTVYDYGPRLKTPRSDGKGGYVMNQNNNEPYYDWNPLSFEHAEMMLRQNPGAEIKYGALLAWSMNKTQWESLVQYGDEVRKDCATCGTMGSIRTVARVCACCGAHVYDPNNTSLTPEQQIKMDKQYYACPQCGGSAPLGETIYCGTCHEMTNRGQPMTPKRATIFDIDLMVKGVAAGDDGKQITLLIPNRSGPRPISVADPKVLETIKPLDLEKKFAPTPLDVQSKTWNIPLDILRAGSPPGVTYTGPQGGVQAPMMGQQPMGVQQPPMMPQMGMAPPMMGVPAMGVQQAPMAVPQTTAPQQQWSPPAVPGTQQQPPQQYAPPNMAQPMTAPQAPAFPGAGMPGMGWNPGTGNQ